MFSFLFLFVIDICSISDVDTLGCHLGSISRIGLAVLCYPLVFSIV